MSDSGGLEKLKIIGYSDNKFSSKTDEMEVQINPTSLKYQKEISYSGGKTSGTQEDSKNFDKVKPTDLNFEFLFDETGVLPLNKDKTAKTIVGVINRFEKLAYTINNETHRPNYLIISWGTFVFKDQLTSASYDYTLFRPDGSPLRVKVTISIEGYMDTLTERKSAGLKSPDLMRVITMTAGNNIALICSKIYRDASYCTDIARINNLKEFRDIKPGTKLIFPPSLQRNHDLFSN